MSNFKFEVYANKEDYLKMKRNFKNLLHECKSLTQYYFVLYNVLRNKEPLIKLSHFGHCKLINFMSPYSFIMYDYCKIFNISEEDLIKINKHICETYFPKGCYENFW